MLHSGSQEKPAHDTACALNHRRPIDVGSANFGPSGWKEVTVGARSAKAHDWYLENVDSVGGVAAPPVRQTSGRRRKSFTILGKVAAWEKRAGPTEVDAADPQSRYQ